MFAILSVMTEVTIKQFAEHARSTAFFLEEPDQLKRYKEIFYGVSEEVDELLSPANVSGGELTTALWGYRTENHKEIRERLCSEAGDVLYFVAAACMLRGVELDAVLRTGGIGEPTFGELDDRFRSAMEHPPGVEPKVNWFALQFWNISPLRGQRDETGVKIFSGVTNEPMFTANGRWLLNNVLRQLIDYSVPFEEDDGSYGEFQTTACLSVAALSAVLTGRFDSSLAMAAEKNMEKRERRKQAGTLKSGEDIDRSRPPQEERPRLPGYEVTFSSVLLA